MKGFNKRKVSVFIFWVIIGGIIGYLIVNSIKPVVNISKPVEIRVDSDKFQFINPILYLRTDKSLYSDEFKNLVNELDLSINSDLSDHTADDISVYFRYLNTGHWTGINENELYRPSSMLKVLTLMSTVKLIEYGAISPTQMIQYNPAEDDKQYYKPNDNMVSGHYPVQDLMKVMIVDSDNGANSALLSNESINAEFNDTYKLFRLPNPSAASTTPDFMSVRSYSVIFRTLYNATYLSDNSSEQVLSLLTHTNFTSGLTAGIPKNIVVAHKFGEATDDDVSGSIISRELHDCGIIYYPGKPYLLCVMTKGTDFSKLEGVISGISEIAYDFVSRGGLGK